MNPAQNMPAANLQIDIAHKMQRLSIIIPVYNERHTVERIVAKVLEAPCKLEKEIVIVDDFSTDGTRDLLPKLREAVEQAWPIKMQTILHDRNRGKGSALRTGFKHATGDVILVQDADLEYDPRDYEPLTQPILEGRADVVFGNRFHGGAHRVLYFWHYVSNRGLTYFCNLLTNLNLNDMEVGYKVFRREVLNAIRLKANRFGFEPEFTIKVAKLKYRIYEVPIMYHGRTYEEGKKITWRDGVAAIWHMLRFKFLS